MDKLVSVVIPTHGGADFLARAIESVLAQTYKNIEIIVVDDNGIGTVNQIKTEKVMDLYKGYENVKYICHEVNKNGSAARNTGVKHSRGEFIALLDDDDTYYSEKIEKQVKAINDLSDDYGLVYCGVSVYRDGNKIRDKYSVNSKNWLYDLLTHKATIGSSTMLVKRSIWEKLGGFDESFRRHQDYEFSVRVASVCKIMPIDYIGMQYNLEFRNSPKSSDIAKQYREHYLEKMKPYIATLSKHKQRVVLLGNRIDISFIVLKEKGLRAFIKEFVSLKPGFTGFFIAANKTIKYFFTKIGAKK